MRKIREVHVRWAMIPVLGFLLSFIFTELHPDTPFSKSVAISTTFTAVLWNGAVLIMSYFRHRFSSIQQTPRRLILTIVSMSIFLIFGANVLRWIMGMIHVKEVFSWDHLFEHADINFIVAFFVASIYESVYFFGKWKETFRQNEELRNQQIRTQFEVLQNQMSPHFLFNSLNTLTALIGENPKIAMDFTQRLSEVYRYILKNKEMELVPLKEELEFCHSYGYLLQMRFPENLHIDCNIDPIHEELFIAPLTLQMLIENAIKHNVVSKGHPLQISIRIESGKMIVKNNFRKKKSPTKSTQTGLANIKKRYSFLVDKEIEILNTKEEFIVMIPLIDIVPEREYVSIVEAERS